MNIEIETSEIGHWVPVRTKVGPGWAWRPGDPPRPSVAQNESRRARKDRIRAERKRQRQAKKKNRDL